MRPIEEIIPHRPPFLFIDGVVEASADKLVATRTVRADEPHFAGHYPGRPIMPGVLLCEAVLQAGCALMVLSAEAEASGAAARSGDPVVTRMNEVRFKRMVKPGDVLEITAEKVETKMGVHFMRGTVRVEGKVAATLEFAVTLAGTKA